MAAEHWFRWHHGTVNDPKWRVIAARASAATSRNVTVGHVLSVWAAMLECASQSTPRGELAGWDDEDVAAGLGFLAEEVTAIREGMQGKVLHGESLSGWNRRQPKAEDGSAAARKRAQRERDKSQACTSESRDESTSHSVSRDVTTETETETETEEEQLSATGDVPVAPTRRPPVPVQAVVDAYNGTLTRLAKVRSITPKRRRAVETLWRTGPLAGDVELFRQYFEECECDPFLSGVGPYRNGHENWRPDFDYLVRPEVVTKTYERVMDAIDREVRQ